MIVSALVTQCIKTMSDDTIDVSSSTNYLWEIWNRKQLKIKNSDYTIRGFSIAALRSNFFIKELNIMFDAGLSANYCPDHIFVTHTHTDHCANLPYHLYTFDKNNQNKKIQIYVPNGCEIKTDNLITSVHTMNGDDFDKPYNIHPVIPTKNFELELKGKKFLIEIIECDHTVPCVGYGLTEIKKKLKPEYLGLKGNAIVELKKLGTDIHRNEFNHVFLYLGDTSHEIFKNPEIIKYSTIMIECTFLLDDTETIARSHLTKHMNWKYLYEFSQCHPEITFILYHFSSKYKREFINEFFDKLNLPNIVVWNSN